MKVDYERISQDYDRYRKVGGPHVPVLARIAKEHRAARVLEVGCGTGNATAAFLGLHRCALVGLDQSAGMLERARAKVPSVPLVRGQADRLPFDSATFDFLYASFLIHHLADLKSLFREWSRVVGPGSVAVATASHDYIRRHPLNPYFPSFCGIDLARFASEETIREHLAAAGWSITRSERVLGPPVRIDAHYACRVAHKFISTLELLPGEEFETGMKRLNEDIASRGVLFEDRWEALVVWGSR